MRLVVAVGRATVWMSLAGVLAGCVSDHTQPRSERDAPVPTVTAAQEAESVPPVAQSVPADPRVGAVFYGDGDLHACTASVLASPSVNLILTAAHCLGPDPEARFVPGFDTDSADDGFDIDAVFLDPRWVAGQDPRVDFAVARVSDADGTLLHAVAGSGLVPGLAPGEGERVTVLGYPAGVGGGPAACTASTASPAQGFPTLHCDGVVPGFSGAPWISGSTVSGLIGGLDGGGCADETSYSPPFGAALDALLLRAQGGGPGDEAPDAYDDGCE